MRLSPLKAIKKFCFQCCGDSNKEVDLCTANKTETGCPLYEFRKGHNPQLKGKRGKGRSAEAMKMVRQRKKIEN